MIILLVALQCVVSPLLAQPPVESVARAIRAGNAGEIVRYSGSTLDVTINNSQATYSKTQGELVLRDFFSRNVVRDFEAEHTGVSASNNSVFTIGTLNTANGKFRVYLLMRQRENGYILAEIRFQK